MTDMEWFALFDKAPQDARKALVAEYSNLVYVIVLSKLRGMASHDDIKDCVSDVFVELFSNMGRFSPEKGSLKNFVTAVAKNTALNAFDRMSTQRSRNISTDDEDVELPVSELDTEDEVLKRVSAQRLLELVKSLGEPDTSIIIYQYYYGFKVSRIAQKLAMTPAAVQKRSIRAREKLKKIIEMEGGFL